MFWLDVAAAAIPAMIIACLFLGVAYSFEYPDWRLLYFLLPFLLTGILSAIARHADIRPMTPLFFAFQIAFPAFLVYRLKGARLPAVFFALFCAVNAWWTAVVVQMANMGNWIADAAVPPG